MSARALVTRAANAGIAVPARTTARPFQTGSHLGTASRSLGYISSARVVSSRGVTAPDPLPAPRSLALRPDGRGRPFGCVAGSGGPPGGGWGAIGRWGAIKRFPTAVGTASSSGSAISLDSEGSSSSSSNSRSSSKGGGDADGAGVIDDGTQRYSVASRALEAGHVVFSRVGGFLVGKPTRHSLQVGKELHLEVENDLKFIDHSCEPNCQLEVVTEAAGAAGGQARSPYLRIVVKAPRVDKNEPLTTDYNAFEVDMSSPFDCTCGAGRCRGRVSGFANLPPAVQREYLDGRWTATRTTPPARAVAGTNGGVGGSVAVGSGKTEMGPAPLTDVVKKWATENTV